MTIASLLRLEGQGKYTELLAKIDEIDLDQLDETDQYHVRIIKGRALNQLKKYDAANQLIEKHIDEIKDLSDIQLLGAALGIKTYSLWRKGDLDEALNEIDIAEKMLENADDSSEDGSINGRGFIYYIVASIYLQKGKNSLAKNYYNKSLQAFELDNFLLGIAKIYNNLGGIARSEGSLSKAIDYYKQSLANFEELDNSQYVAMVNNNIGGVFLQLGELEAALTHFEASLTLRKVLNVDEEIAQTLHNISIVYYRMGNLDRAYDYQEQSYTLRKQLTNIRDISWSQKTLGDILQDKGELEKSLDYYQEALMLRQKIGDHRQIAQSFHDIGKIYHKLGELSLAKSHYLRSLDKFEEIKVTTWASEVIFDLVMLYIEEGNIEEAEKFKDMLEELTASSPEQKLIQLRCQLAIAIINKQGNRFSEKIKSQEKLRDIIEQGFYDFKISTIALVNLCELYILEFKVTEEEKILDQIHDIITELSELALDQQSYTVFVESLILQAKVSLLKLEVEEALDLLNEASYTCNERSLLRLQDKVLDEQEHLVNQMELWGELVESNASFIERINNSQIIDYINDVADYVSKL